MIKWYKNLKKDIAILKKLKVDYLFAPTVKEIYKDKKIIIYGNFNVRKTLSK